MALTDSGIAATEEDIGKIENEISDYKDNLKIYEEVFQDSEWFPFFNETKVGEEIRNTVDELSANMTRIEKSLTDLCEGTRAFLNAQKIINERR